MLWSIRLNVRGREESNKGRIGLGFSRGRLVQLSLTQKIWKVDFQHGWSLSWGDRDDTKRLVWERM